MENPYCNSVVFAKGIPISLYAFGHHRPDRVKNNKGPADICKQHHNFGAE